MWQSADRPVTKLVASNNSKIDYSNVRIEIVTSKPFLVVTTTYSDGCGSSGVMQCEVF